MGYEYPVDKTKNKLEHLLTSDKDKIFVATVQSIVGGYIHANNYDTIYAPHMKNIMGIAVSSEYKKQGIGKAMLKEVEKWAKETGASGIRLVSGQQEQGRTNFTVDVDMMEVSNNSISKNTFSLDLSKKKAQGEVCASQFV